MNRTASHTSKEPWVSGLTDYVGALIGECQEEDSNRSKVVVWEGHLSGSLEVSLAVNYRLGEMVEAAGIEPASEKAPAPVPTSVASV